jgi:HAD superfamily phosphatase (TIGR01668 family)
MNDFRAGKFHRESVHFLLRPICPAHASLSLMDIRPGELAELGKKLVLLDVDNTLLPWRDDELPQSSLDWVAEAKAAGLELCILSNTRHPERLHRLADRLSIQYLRGRFKPSTAMYLQALKQFQVEAAQAIMIGDQLFTDILGANRAGIEAVWVRPMTPRDFVGTKVSRFGERLARPILYRSHSGLAMPIAADELPPNEVGIVELAKAPLVKQFIKFCIVGGSSFVIDYCVRMTLLFAIPSGNELMSDVVGRSLLESYPWLFANAQSPKDAFFPIAAFVGAVFGMMNSFIWNRRWTFKIRGKEERFRQLQKFLAVSLVGLILNVVISTALNHVIPGNEKDSARLATVIAAAAVAFWNFAGQKFFAFRTRGTSS